ncbi:MAG: class II aldolase/adducin family protein [Gemmatimonadales bacterium]
MIHRAERDAVLDAARRAVALGLTHGTSGNVSRRAGDGFVVTPTGLAVETLVRDDIVALSLEGVPLPGEIRAPSSEWPMHAAIYRARPDLQSIVHGHSPAATAVACLGRDIPPFHYMIAIAGGDSIRCAGYAPFGSDELAANALAALRDRRACLLAHHGFVAAGADLGQAMAVAAEIEFLADLYLRLLPLGDPAVLSPDQMREVRRRFAGYGQPG